MYTANSSWFTSQEKVKGAIVPGQLASARSTFRKLFFYPRR